VEDLPLEVTAFDRRLGARAAAIAALGAAIALLVIAATDEGGPWRLRLGMLAALTPVAGALGTFAAVRLAAARGEMRALAAIGVDPLRAASGAAAAGAIAGALGPALLALGLGDPAALFPRIAAARRWITDGDGLVEKGLGIRVGPGGALGLGPVGEVTAAPPGVLAAALALAAAGIAAPLWIAATEERSSGRRATVAATAGLATIASFQAIAAGRAPAAALAVGSLVLLIDAAASRYRARRS
jgi:hypothetical protein